MTVRNITGVQTFDNQAINEVNKAQLSYNKMLNSLQTVWLLNEYLLFNWRKLVCQSFVYLVGQRSQLGYSPRGLGLDTPDGFMD